LFESWPAHLSVKQAAKNRVVAPNGSIPSRLTCSDCGWCRSRFHKPVCQIRFLKSLLKKEMTTETRRAWRRKSRNTNLY